MAGNRHLYLQFNVNVATTSVRDCVTPKHYSNIYIYAVAMASQDIQVIRVTSRPHKTPRLFVICTHKKVQWKSSRCENVLSER